MSPRRPRYLDGTVLQQSMVMDSDSMAREGGMPSHVLGVVLEVFPADNSRNRTAFQRTDSRGFLHEAKVMIIMDGTDSVMTLDNVVICPDHVTGLDDYHEQLPRGSTRTISGQNFDGQMYGINPYDLDGDWCVVSFLGGSSRHPFISRWWPHARNTHDPATSGNGNPDDRGTPKALDQGRRHFRRVNGIEQVITPEGDIYVSTRLANSTLSHENPTDGRYGREESETGGTIAVNVKPSQRFLLDFNQEIVGAHHLSGFDDSLPQANPRPVSTVATRSTGSTRVVGTRGVFRINSPKVTIFASETVGIDADEMVEISSGEEVSISTDVMTVVADDSISMNASSIDLGTEDPEYLIKGESYDTRTGLQIDIATPALEAAFLAVGVAATNTLLAKATEEALGLLFTLIVDLQRQIGQSLTTKTSAE